MNKSEIAVRLAGRTGMIKAVAKDAVDGVFEVIGEALQMARKCGLPDSVTSAPGTARPEPGATRARARAWKYRFREH